MVERNDPSRTDRLKARKLAQAARGKALYGITTKPSPETRHVVHINAFTSETPHKTEFARAYINPTCIDIDDIKYLQNVSDKSRYPEPKTPKGREQRNTKIIETKYRINDAVYTSLKSEFGVRDPITFFETKWETGKDSIRKHLRTLHGDLHPSIGNELESVKTPADAIALLVDKNIADELKGEIKRTLLFARLAADLEKNVSGLDNKFKQLQSLLNEKLFAGKMAETKILNMEGIFDDENKVVAIRPKVEKNRIFLREGHTSKDITIKARTVEVNQKYSPGEIQKKVLDVVQKVDTKDITSSMQKALRKSINDRDDDTVYPSYVNDSHRMLFIVNGDAEDAELVRSQLFDVITEDYNEEQQRGRKFEEKIHLQKFYLKDDAKSYEVGKTDKYARLGLELYFGDDVIEIFVQTIDQYIDNLMHVGKSDEQTGRYNGAAHELYEIYRADNEKLHELYVDPKFNPKPATRNRSRYVATKLTSTDTIFI